MKTHIIIPWREGNDDARVDALNWITNRWESAAQYATHKVHLGVLSADSDWCKADAVQIGIEAADPDDDDILIITDADVWTSIDDVVAAANAVASGPVRWAMPHSLVHRLSAKATEAAMYGQSTLAAAAAVHGYDRAPYLGTVGGGTTILSAADYQTCPLDPRFVDWGQEDEAWGDALRTVLGRRHRGNGDMYHLWHPPLPRMAPGVGNIQGKHLRARYQKHVGDANHMQALIESGREHLIGN